MSGHVLWRQSIRDNLYYISVDMMKLYGAYDLVVVGMPLSVVGTIYQY